MLARLIDAQLVELDALLVLLDEERNLLLAATPDGEALTRVAIDKQRSLGKLDSLEQSRRSAQEDLGFATGTAASAAAASSARCMAAWQRLQHTAQRVFHLNRTNGELVQHRLSCNQQILNFLRENRGPTIYGPDGQARNNAPRLNSRA